MRPVDLRTSCDHERDCHLIGLWLAYCGTAFFQLQEQYAECVNQLIMVGPMNNLERRGSLNKPPRYILLQNLCYSLISVI